MARAAQRDMENKTIVVQKHRLIGKLRSNLKQHVADYDEAIKGYRATLAGKIDEACDKAMLKLKADRLKLMEEVSAFTDEDISKQRDYFDIVEPISVEMKVPRCYKAEYELAISMAEWESGDTIKLTYAEFTCFIRDEWDWKQSFDLVTASYKQLMNA